MWHKISVHASLKFEIELPPNQLSYIVFTVIQPFFFKLAKADYIPMGWGGFKFEN